MTLSACTEARQRLARGLTGGEHYTSPFFGDLLLRLRSGLIVITTIKGVGEWPGVLAGVDVLVAAIPDPVPPPLPRALHQRAQLPTP